MKLQAVPERSHNDEILAKIWGNIILPQGVRGNPEAVFDVAVLPTG